VIVISYQNVTHATEKDMSQKKIKNPDRIRKPQEPSVLSQTIRGLIDKVSNERQNRAKNENMIIGSMYNDGILTDSTPYSELRKLGEANGFQSIGRFRSAIDRWKTLRKQEEIIRKKIEEMMAKQGKTTDDSNTEQSGEVTDTPAEQPATDIP